VWAALDDWINALSEEAFVKALPLVRRTFANYPAPERRLMGERIAGRKAPRREADLDPRRAALVLPVLEEILR
jgi:hypothetical protein